MPPIDEKDFDGRTLRAEVEDLIAQHGFTAVLAVFARLLRKRTRALEQGSPDEAANAHAALAGYRRIRKAKNALRDLDL